jgi:hypothetical protein
VSARLGALVTRDLITSSRYWLVAGVGALVVAVWGALDRTADASGADQTLLGITLAIVVPLSSYGLFESVHRKQRTSALLAPLARHGADRHALAAGVWLVLAAASVLTTSVLSVLAILASSQTRPGLGADAWASAWGGALVGAAYAGLFGVGSRWGRAGRLWLLFGDLVLGSGSGFFALPWVRGHARNLLGGDAVLGTSPTFAALALVAISALGLLVTAKRGPR